MSAKKKTAKNVPAKKRPVKKAISTKQIILISAIALLLLAGIVWLLVSYFHTTNTVVIEVKDFGDIVVELDPEAAPITVKNFKKLVRRGFYKKSQIHRIVEGFVIQGGASDKGKEAKTIVGEFSANGINNPLNHERGVISMARTNVYDSASSQFFIVLETSEDNSYYLDGKYAAFGRVIEGMDVVDAIAAVRTYGESPMQDIRITRAYFK